MTSFISNFKKSFFWKGFIVLLFMILTYHFVVQSLERKLPTDAYQSNIVTAQNFVYSPTSENDIVVVGSSLSTRLINPVFPSPFYNLSFGGGSVFTGIDIILRSHRKPRLVLIETNVLNRAVNTAFIDNLFQQPLHKLKQYFPELRDQFQPTRIFIQGVKFFLGKSNENRWSEKPNPELLTKLIKEQMETYEHFSSDSEMNDRLNDLRIRIEQLQDKGISFAFFEMPIDPRLQNLERAQKFRKSFEENFPLRQYLKIPNSSDLSYETNDGLHLHYASAYRYSEYLASQLKEILSRVR